MNANKIDNLDEFVIFMLLLRFLISDLIARVMRANLATHSDA